MPIATWRDEYSVNVEEIDLQHQKLLELVNGLHTAVESRIDKEELRGQLIKLVEFTREHFATEERLMEAHGYPDSNQHHEEHRLLLQHMDDLVAGVSSGKYPTFYSDYDVSNDWALIHINESDKKLGAYLNSKEIF